MPLTATHHIELVITWRCNLGCDNCNQCCSQAPTNKQMSLEQVAGFAEESRRTGKRWGRVSLFGGEPLLHPDLKAMVATVRPVTDSVRIVTNGIVLAQPADYDVFPDRGDWWVNTAKPDAHPAFDSFCVAPRDLNQDHPPFEDGCWIARQCGLGMSPFGYYPCSPAASIDRVFDLGLAVDLVSILRPEVRVDLRRTLCSLCGHFAVQHMGQSIVCEQCNSPSWASAFESYAKRRSHA